MAVTFPERPVRSLYMHIQYVSRRDGVSKGIRMSGISQSRAREDDAHGVGKGKGRGEGKGKENLMHQEVEERGAATVKGAAMVNDEAEERKEDEEDKVIKVVKVAGRTEVKSGSIGAKTDRRAGRKAGPHLMTKAAARSDGGPMPSRATLRAGPSPRSRTRSRSQSRSLSFPSSAGATTFGESRELWLESVATAAGGEVAGANESNGGAEANGARADTEGKGTRAGSASVEMARAVWDTSFAVLADDLTGDRLTDAISSGIVDLEAVSTVPTLVPYTTFVYFVLRCTLLS